MPTGLVRRQREGHDHFITFSCHRRGPSLNTASARSVFLDSLERTRSHYTLDVLGYVVMPEHVHLLLSEPHSHPLATALQALKVSAAKRLSPTPFWTIRYFDFNVFTHNKRVENLKYMHRNPVPRGLVQKPEQWQSSTYRHYLLQEPTPVQITHPY